MTDLEESLLDRSKERRALVLLFITCFLLMAGGLAFTLIAGAAPNVVTVELANVAEAEFVEIRDHRGVTVLSGEFRSHVDALGNTEKDAALMDRRGRRVVGEVELELPADGREDRRPELEVDIIELAPRQTFAVVIDDRQVATFATDDRGSIDMELQEGEVTPPPAPAPAL
jgi:hypothetical protein